MQFGILGPLEVTVNGRPLALGGARAREVLATLLVHCNRAVTSDQLVDELWPGKSAGKATASLQVRLSELRRLLRSAEGCADRLATRPPGYLLRVGTGERLGGGFFRNIRIARYDAQRRAERCRLGRIPPRKAVVRCLHV